MQTKNRKIKKEELELWKKVTEHEEILGQYSTSVEENIIKQKELIIKKEFLNRGYIIKKIKNKKSLNFINSLQIVRSM